MITINNLSKTYKVHKSVPGVKNALIGFFSRDYQEVNALNNVSFHVGKGSVTGLLGKNGAGKTTLLKILTGLLYPTDGSVKVANFVPYERENEFKKKISFLMGQKGQLWWDLPAMQSYILNKSIFEVNDGFFQQRLDDLTNMFGVHDILHIPVRKLSFGQRMKLEIIGALIHGPEVIFLDEPTIGLDLESQQTIREFIIQHNQLYQTTFIVTSHNLHDIESVCNEVIVIDHGSLIIKGTLKNVVDSYANEKIVDILFDRPVRNEFIERLGVITKQEDNSLQIVIDKSKTKDVLSYCYDAPHIIDINIQDLPLELVISRIIS